MPLGGLVAGKFSTSAQLVADAVEPSKAGSDEANFGRCLARTTCAQCHGAALHGDSHPEADAPTLLIVAAYSPEAFTQLMRTGVALGGRKLGVMRFWAKDNLSHLSDSEIAALYSYLHALAGAAPPS
jgi:cytochrome c553